MSADQAADDSVAEVFRLRDDFFAAHPEIAEMLYLCEWHAWFQRRIQRLQVFEEVYRNGELVARRAVTADDSEPQRPAAQCEHGRPFSAFCWECIERDASDTAAE